MKSIHMRRGRPFHPAKTALGAAMRAKRGDATGEDTAAAIGFPRSTYYRIERGAQEPAFDTARRLGEWLGMSVEAVIEAARKPPQT